MTSKLVADLVVGIPYGDGGKKKWVRVGALLKMDNNDESKGPGFVVMLDRHFNPAGVPTTREGETSIALSAYYPSEQRGEAAKPLRGAPPRRIDYGDDDDIPF